MVDPWFKMTSRSLLEDDEDAQYLWDHRHDDGFITVKFDSPSLASTQLPTLSSRFSSKRRRIMNSSTTFTSPSFAPSSVVPTHMTMSRNPSPLLLSEEALTVTLSSGEESLAVDNVKNNVMEVEYEPLDALSELINAHFKRSLLKDLVMEPAENEEEDICDVDPNCLKKRYPLSFDPLIRFQKVGHLYWWRNAIDQPFDCRLITSVSKIYGSVEIPFDADYMAPLSAAKNRRLAGLGHIGEGELTAEHRVLEQDLGTLFETEALKTKWKEKGDTASALGTKLHAEIERYYNFNVYPEHPSKEFGYFLEFAKLKEHSRKMIYRTELSMFYAPLRIAGQADALFRVKEGDDTMFDLYDWCVVVSFSSLFPFLLNIPTNMQS